MIVAFDTSALVKLFLDEEDAELAREVWRRATQRVTSVLALAEGMAALSAAERMRRVTSDGARRFEQGLLTAWRGCDAVEVTESIATRAGLLAREHTLSGADAVHLATALEVASPSQVVLATWDQRLSDAALGVGLSVVP